MSVNLPKGENETGPNEWADVSSNDLALKNAVEALQLELATAKSEIDTLQADSPLVWHEPVVDATEDAAATASFTVIDEIPDVVVPANGIVVLRYSALAKRTTDGTMMAAIFIDENQLRQYVDGAAPAVQEASRTTLAAATDKWHLLRTSPLGLAMANAGADTSFVTTGMTGSEVIVIERLPAGTYDFSIRGKASTGSMLFKERCLQIGVIG